MKRLKKSFVIYFWTPLQTFPLVRLVWASSSFCNPNKSAWLRCDSAYLSDAGTSESDDDGHYVHCELELQELGNAVVDVSPPHHRLDNAAEVIVSQDDVRCLFCHVRPGDALTEFATVRRTCTESRHESWERSSILIVLESYCLDAVLFSSKSLQLAWVKRCGQRQMHATATKIFNMHYLE